ncbi:alpha/beta hydrolase-fold protein [Pseudoduganella sp. SL102]|uniref:alpha/beta hydrolase-fold protein n=1 Tax=Pseudoduganella sp. SL102 TaxID=2995154 RepID=UPI00248B9650|nr:alpha/beta hydrolase-fold protein [Pseudoduganella sp. SL102]WBS01944.1 alpha/beta hydrolase-fold protein [Pseudoduganella sp. SL102]
MNRTAIATATLALLAASPLQCAEQEVPFGSWGRQENVRITTPDDTAPLRTYTHRTTMALRDGDPQTVTYAESADLPRVRSGNLAFDALFAMAMAEMRQDAVSHIRDDSYNVDDKRAGQPIPCECFETGEKWHYVWTRDLSYAAGLGLGMLDPQRVRNSLQFKLSGYRDGLKKPAAVPGSGDGLQIVQDTGSGGSWPVSTDRVTWAFGADEALKALPPAERAAFAPIALKALRNTIEIDRVAVFDPAAGLYNGEESFLDWREQSYAGWIPGQLAHMATAKALSTNVAHYKALSLAAQLAGEQGDAATAQRYGDWAVQLKDAINGRLWLKDAGMYSSLTAGHFDGAPQHKFDWLGQALAIVTGVADAEQAASIVERYPDGPMGAPVIWPQQPDRAVYHNRAIWPFVTAYGLKAAIQTLNVEAADAAYDTLLRAAAVNASNMENFEWLTGLPMFDPSGGKQPELAGPVVNSRRQLWSVGGLAGALIGGAFGISTTSDGIVVAPFITSKLRNEAFQGASSATLSGLKLRGHAIDVQVVLPPPQFQAGYHEVQQVLLNGKPVDPRIKWADLAERNTIVVQLGPLLPGRQKLTRVAADPLAIDPAVFSPAEPAIASASRGKLAFGAAPAGGAVYNVYRDGRLVAANVKTAAWTDPAPRAAACYAVEAVYPVSGNRSHHSAPACTGAAIDIPAGDARIAASIRARGGVIGGWGAPEDTFKAAITVRQPGTYAVQVRYRNNAHQVNLGITGGVKWMKVLDAGGGTVAQGVVQLPHSPEGQPVYSTPLAAQLAAGRYTVELTDFINMSSLQSNATYADAGGKAGPMNRFDIHGLRLLATSAPAPAPVAKGRLEIVDRFASPQLGNERKLRIWLPPGYDSNAGKRYPVLYMHDGQNLFDQKTAYSTEWHIDEVADRLAAQGDMREIIVVGVDNTPDRNAEYTPCCDPRWGGGKVAAYGRFLADTVKPYIDSHYRTLPDRANTAVMGSSFGGLASLYMAQHHADVFGHAGIMSGSFFWNGGALVGTAPRAAATPVRLYVDAGTGMDGVESTRAFHKALLDKGWRAGGNLLYVEDEGGIHNERAWAGRVHRALTWFFPPAQPRSGKSASAPVAQAAPKSMQ